MWWAHNQPLTPSVALDVDLYALLMRAPLLLFRSLCSGAGRMADLAAGKKAAARRAIDEYVKVSIYLCCMH